VDKVNEGLHKNTSTSQKNDQAKAVLQKPQKAYLGVKTSVGRGQPAIITHYTRQSKQEFIAAFYRKNSAIKQHFPCFYSLTV
jgi:hypothetical protein